MAATVQFRQKVGAGPTVLTGITNYRFKNADNNDQDTANPMVIPASGTNFSFLKSLYIHATVAPDNDIDNVDTYGPASTGDFGTHGVQLHIANQDITHAQYAQATSTSYMTNHANITSATDYLATYTTASARTITDLNIGAATGIITDITVFQVRIPAAATVGTIAALTNAITFRFDET